ncbi:DUF5684 domain-containing protein [Microbacterium aureliae]
MSTDTSALTTIVWTSTLLSIVLYVWLAVALSAVFRKSGEEAFKAWIPFLNVFTLLQLGGMSGWLVLLIFLPFLGPVALWIALIVACHRINASFGLGVGMTVLAALLLPVWATIVGFGPARWLGTDAAGPRRTGDAALTPPPRTPGPLFGTPPADSAPVVLARPAPLPGQAGRPAAPADPPAAAARPAAPPARPASAEWAPTPAPAMPASWADADRADEVTGAISGAPEPIAAVPGRPARPAEPAYPARPAEPAHLAQTPPAQTPPARAAGAAPEAASGDFAPPVMRAPARPDAQPWSPARSPLPDPDGFPEASGEVSAVAGAPTSGTPRSALSSVSAQFAMPGIPDDIDHTVIASRRRMAWALVLPTGAHVPLTEEVVLVGRRPARSSAFPGAQLVEIDDGTVSKTHLRLEKDGELWRVVDLHSTNGTVLVGPDGAETEIAPGTSHPASATLLVGDAEVRLVTDDHHGR